MASYDVAVWLRSEDTWPQITLLVSAATAREAVFKVLHARQVRRAVKVAVNSRDGFIHRWYGVTTLADGFGSQRTTCLPMGWPVAQPMMGASEEGMTYGA